MLDDMGGYRWVFPAMILAGMVLSVVVLFLALSGFGETWLGGLLGAWLGGLLLGAGFGLWLMDGGA